MFKVLPVLELFCRTLSLSWLPGCGHTSPLLFIIGDNIYPGDLCLCLSPLNLEMENLPTAVSCVGTSAIPCKTPFHSCTDFFSLSVAFVIATFSSYTFRISKLQTQCFILVHFY